MRECNLKNARINFESIALLINLKYKHTITLSAVDRVFRYFPQRESMMAFSFWFYQPDPTFTEGAKIFDVASSDSAVPTRAHFPPGFDTVTYIEVRSGANGDSKDWPVVKTYLVNPERLTKAQLVSRLEETGGQSFVQAVRVIDCDEWYLWEAACMGQLTEVRTESESALCVLRGKMQMRIAYATDPRYALLQ